jgi:hypothetical protein
LYWVWLALEVKTTLLFNFPSSVAQLKYGNDYYNSATVLLDNEEGSTLYH